MGERFDDRSGELAGQCTDAVVNEGVAVDVSAFSEWTRRVVDPEVGFASGPGERRVTVFSPDAGVDVDVAVLEGLTLGGRMVWA